MPIMQAASPVTLVNWLKNQLWTRSETVSLLYTVYYTNCGDRGLKARAEGVV